MGFRPEFGKPIKEQEKLYGDYLEQELRKTESRDRDSLWGKARRLAGDSFCDLNLAVNIALEDHISIKDAVILAHMHRP